MDTGGKTGSKIKLFGRSRALTISVGSSTFGSQSLRQFLNNKYVVCWLDIHRGI